MDDMSLNREDPSAPHLSEEMAEGYVMRKLSESEEQTVEEHLLACSACLDLVEKTEEFVLVMREAMQRETRAAPNRPARTPWLSWKWFAPAFGTAVLAAGLVIQFSAGIPPTSPAEVSLTAFRSAESATAPAGRKLTLSLELAGLPDSASHQYRIVRASGEPVAQGQANITGDKATVQLSRPLAADDYWVRLYSGEGALVREYGLKVK